MSTHGGQVETLVACPPGAACLIAHGGELVWSEPDAGIVRRLRRDQSQAWALAIEQASPTEVAAHAGIVAWINRGAGQVLAMPL
jgi:hypothetical protein